MTTNGPCAFLRTLLFYSRSVADFFSRIPIPSRYTFTDYSSEWPGEFRRESERLKSLLKNEFITVHHIGSMSVPSLAAKPIIDLLPVMHCIARIDDCTAKIEQAGYQSWGEYGLSGRRYCTKNQGTLRTHNLHMYEERHPDIERHLAFRAYLRNDATICAEYQGGSKVQSL